MSASEVENRDRYLATLRQLLIGVSRQYPYRFYPRPNSRKRGPMYDGLAKHGVEFVTRQPPKNGRDLISDGAGWPVTGLTMLGEKRLFHLQHAVETVIKEGIPGDFIETGVWRGGACILMRAILQAYGITDRRVFVADSFAGLPPPDPKNYPEDAGDRHHQHAALTATIDEVKANFEAHGLLDDQVVFLKGWFKDTLPGVKDNKWAIVRLDGDMYESTIQGFDYLYPGLSQGGFLIVDDYGAVEACAKATHDYRDKHGITEPMTEIDWTGTYWRKGQHS